VFLILPILNGFVGDALPVGHDPRLSRRWLIASTKEFSDSPPRSGFDVLGICEGIECCGGGFLLSDVAIWIGKTQESRKEG